MSTLILDKSSNTLADGFCRAGGLRWRSSPCSAAYLSKSLCTTAVGQKYGFPPALGVQTFTRLCLPLALSSARQLGKKVLNSLFSQGVLYQMHCADLLGTSCISPRQRLLGGSYSIKIVFGQVPTCFRQLLEVQAWIFPMGHLEGEELVAWWGGREVFCPYPACLPGAGKKHHHHFFPDKFFSGICL